MKRPIYFVLLVAFSVWVYGAPTRSQPRVGALLDKVADGVIRKFQNSSCQDLAMMGSEEEATDPSGLQANVKERVITMLREDPQKREEFLNKIAGPIVNRMFECGLVP